ncbi:MAG TPA: ABC transporter permease [Pirellulaceae bacterium]|nr:ABC transporter permease [Pirellulaceae bacterium]
MDSLPRLLDIDPRIWIPLAALLVIIALLALLGKVPLSYVFGNLAVRWHTTFLTALAFTLVISLLTVMLAFVNGMYALTKGSGHPENVIILSEGATDEGFSNLGYGDVGEIENQPGIARVDDKPLVSRETYIVVNQPIKNAPAGRPNRRFLQLRGIQDGNIAAAVHRIDLYPGGEWFSEAGVRERQEGTDTRPLIEVTIGEGIAREMGRDRQPEALATAKNAERLDVGDTFVLNDRTWLITGVMQSSGSTFDSEVWGKQSLIGPLFGKETYSTLVARAPTAADAQTLQKFLTNDYKKSAINAQVETEYFAKLSQTNVQFLFAIGVVTFFLAIGGMFGIMNTMFAAISQRIKDIGVLRLLGYRRRHILATFLLESAAIALVGGLLGCALGMLFDGTSANSIVSSGPGGGKFVVLRLTVDNQTFAINMLLSLAMGLFGGLLPSIRAMRYTALETLR